MDIEIFEWMVAIAMFIAVIPALIVMWLALYDELCKRWGK